MRRHSREKVKVKNETGLIKTTRVDYVRSTHRIIVVLGRIIGIVGRVAGDAVAGDVPLAGDGALPEIAGDYRYHAGYHEQRYDVDAHVRVARVNPESRIPNRRRSSSFYRLSVPRPVERKGRPATYGMRW